jgi:hypothetical protein
MLGNQAVQRLIEGTSNISRGVVQSPGRLQIQRDDDNDPSKPRPLVGQNSAVDPKDNSASATWSLGGSNWWLPKSFQIDPGMLRLPGSGDPLKYPTDRPDADPALANGIDRPTNCPPDRWVPPSRSNWFYGRCLPVAPPQNGSPPQNGTPSQSVGPPQDGAPDSSTQPGDYNVPSPDNDSQTA